MRHALAGLLALPMAGCASIAADRHDLDPVWDNPTASHGRVFDVVVYPNDLLGDPDRYVMCLDACPGEQAVNVMSVLTPRVPGSYTGFQGDRPVRLRVKFDGRCFREGSLCLLDHRPLIFVEQ